MRKLVIITFIVSLFTDLHTHQAIGKSPTMLDFHIEMPPWEEVEEMLPRKSTFTVIDVESGKRFDVQRRAGSSHADVQPLTYKDTKIMKDIYDGSWSWKRRAVLIYSNNFILAASMHGMPHGAGALKNGFPGHFCIHFNGSTTHKTQSPDLSHHLMILKAGGGLKPFLRELQPKPLLEAFLAGVKNGDKGLVKQTMTYSNADLKSLEKIEALRWNLVTTEIEYDQSLITKVDADLQLFIKETGPLNTKTTFTVIRTSPTAPWKVDGSSLFRLLKN